ncbi:MAG: AMP-dependent synthetase [Spirochaetaceae bacterium]|nr:MAG: AMP-dependent synthetase [Spirochaetaceae bacterium]
MLVHDFLSASAARTPTSTALVCGKRRASYAEIDRKANQLARALVAAGVGRGQRVVIQERNSISAVIAIFGVLKAGAVAVPLHPATRARKLAIIVHDCAAVALIGGSAALRGAGSLFSGSATLRVVVSTLGDDDPAAQCADLTFERVFRAYDDSDVRVPLTDSDLAFLIYTSERSGDPKGVVCGHENVVAAADATAAQLEITARDIVINVVAFCFDYGLYQLLTAFRCGATLVIQDAFGQAAAILRAIERERVTGFPLVPPLLSVLLELDLHAFDLGSLRYIVSSAAPLPAGHSLALRHRLPHVKVYSMYGTAECGPALCLPPEKLQHRPGSVGIPVPGTEAWLESDDGTRPPAGVAGELVIRGANVMRGYWADAALSSRFFRPGPTPGEIQLHTGDLFCQDEQGMFHFVARAADTIASAAVNVAPREIEAIINELSAVRECAVVGVPDPVRGQAIKACLVRGDPALTDLQVLRHCRTQLESFNVPRFVEFVESLPKHPGGAIDRRGLTSARVAASTALPPRVLFPAGVKARRGF